MLSSKPRIPSGCPAPQHTHSCFLTLQFPCIGTYDLCNTKGLSSHWWPTRSSSATYAARDTSSGGILFSSYCCSSYRVTDPFSSLGTFSSSFIGGPVFHSIDDCEPFLWLQQTALWLSCLGSLPVISCLKYQDHLSRFHIFAYHSSQVNYCIFSLL